MSLNKEIEKALQESKALPSRGWVETDKWNLVQAKFSTREEATKAYEKILPTYLDIVKNQTWSGRQAQGLKPDNYSFRHHYWIDEKDDGFFLCASFDKKPQADYIKSAIDTEYKNNATSLDPFTINQTVSDRLNRYMRSTHSVEIDVPNADFNEDLFNKFKNCSDFGADRLLYADAIQKPNAVTRMKVYLKSAEDAEIFEEACKNAMQGLKSEAVVRKFPMAARKDFGKPSTELPIDEKPIVLEEISNTNLQYVTSLMFKHDALDAQTLCNVFLAAAIASQAEAKPKASIIKLEEKDGMRTVVFSSSAAQSKMKINFERLVNERLPKPIQNNLGCRLEQSTNQYPKAKVA